MNKVVPTDSVAYPAGKLSDNAGQVLEDKLSKVEIVTFDKLAAPELANTVKKGAINGVAL